MNFSVQFYNVYFLYLAEIVDSGWTEYGEWSECSATCGGGRQSRRRTCTKPPPANGGQRCSGQATQNRVCSTAKCPGKTRKHYDRDGKIAIDIKINIYTIIYSEFQIFAL